MIWGSLLWYFTLDSFYNYVIGGPYVGALARAITGSTFWLTTILTVFILMAPVLAWRFYSFDCNPSLADKIRVKQRHSKMTRGKVEMLRTPSARRSRRSLRSSYAFAHEVSWCLFFSSESSRLHFHCRRASVASSLRVKSCGKCRKILPFHWASEPRSSTRWSTQRPTASKLRTKSCREARTTTSAPERRSPTSTQLISKLVVSCS